MDRIDTIRCCIRGLGRLAQPRHRFSTEGDLT